MTREPQDARQEAPTRRQGGSALRAFYATKNPHKTKDSINDIRIFAEFCGCETEERLEDLLFGASSTQERAQDFVTRYRDHLKSKKLAYGTINRRLTAVRTLVRVAKLIGAVSWEIDISVNERISRRDTRGVSKRALKIVKRMSTKTIQARRDKAIVSLAHHVGLTRAETVALILEHYDPSPSRPSVTIDLIEKRKVGLSKKVKQDLDAWIEVRGFKPGALFTHLDRKRSPMTQDEIIALVRPGSILS